MKRILVSGASGIVGYGILKSLRLGDPQATLIGTTIYSDSVAPKFCDIVEVAPKTADVSYISWLCELISQYTIDLLIPGIEIDLYTWMAHQELIEATGCRIAQNNRDLIALCKDKWLFYSEFSKSNLPYVIETTLTSDFDYLEARFGIPFLIKPKRGFGSKGISTIHNRAEYDSVAGLIGTSHIAQSYVGSSAEEYTSSVFGDGKGSYTTHISMQRSLSAQGFTEKATVCDLEEAEKVFGDLCAYFKPLGPTNFQFRKDNGQYKLLEINPRISSSTSLRTAFGYNECQMAVDYFLHRVLPVQPKVSFGYAVRYTEDYVVL